MICAESSDLLDARAYLSTVLRAYSSATTRLMAMAEGIRYMAVCVEIGLGALNEQSLSLLSGVAGRVAWRIR